MSTKPINWNYALLASNPFGQITPSTENIVWAGMSNIKRQLDQLFIEAQATSSTQVVLNWGAYGSGKTHAAIYYSSSDRLPKLEGTNIEDLILLRIRTPND